MAGSVMRKSTGLKRTALGESGGKSRTALGTAKRRYPYFAVCIDNHGYEGSLIIGKVYRIIRPLPDDLSYDLRVVDEENEDYLYGADRFVTIDVPNKVKHALAATSWGGLNK
jgi:hypothetical protein